jgi:hypothetical protein
VCAVRKREYSESESSEDTEEGSPYGVAVFERERGARGDGGAQERQQLVLLRGHEAARR